MVICNFLNFNRYIDMNAKKFIIETHKDCGNFGVLVLTNNDEGRNIGVLEMFNFKADKGMRKIGVEDLEHDGWKEFATELVKKAEEVCNENGYTLWTY